MPIQHPFMTATKLEPAPSKRALSHPELPGFLSKVKSRQSHSTFSTEAFNDLLAGLSGELGFQEQQTAMRWLLEQLQECGDLRGLILTLLQHQQDPGLGSLPLDP